MAMDDLLKPEQVASRLGMSRIWVYKQAERGLIPFYRIGEAIRFKPEEIEAWLESRKGLKRDSHLSTK